MEQTINPFFINSLIKLVGITRTDCNCYPVLEEELRSTVNGSISGKYIDEEPHLFTKLLTASNGCDDENMFNNLIKYRAIAAQDLILVTSTKLFANFTTRFDRTVSYGSTDYGKQLTGLSSGRKSIFIETKELIGGVLHLTHNGFLAQLPSGIFYDTVDLTITKHKNNIATDLFEWTFRVDNVTIPIRGKSPDKSYAQMPDDGIELPLDGSTYEIWYDYDPNKFVPYSNTVSCTGCMKTRSDNSYIYMNLPSGEAYGMTFYGRLYCDSLGILPYLSKRNKLIQALIIEALIYRTLEYSLAKAEASNEGDFRVPAVLQENAKTQSNYEALISAYSISYQETVDKIVETTVTDEDNNGCYICRVGTNGARTGML